MKFETEPRFDKEFNALPREHRRKFLAIVPVFNAACAQYMQNPGTPWPAALRVGQLSSAKGIWELTWSFKGPDGRATFEFIPIGDETGVRWRRIGRHDIYDNP